MNDFDIAMGILGVCFIVYWVALFKNIKDNQDG